MSEIDKKIKQLKQVYKKGTRVKLYHMEDNLHPIPDGSIGVVEMVDDAGQIHCRWPGGRSLAVIPEVDSFELVDETFDLSTFILRGALTETGVRIVSVTLKKSFFTLSTDRTIIIPLAVDGRKIEEIFPDAFRGISKDTVNTIRIASDLERIDENTFRGCPANQVILAEVKTIGKRAFADCKNLKSLYAPKCERVEELALMNTALENVKLPKATYIADSAIPKSAYRTNQCVLHVDERYLSYMGEYNDVDVIFESRN